MASPPDQTRSLSWVAARSGVVAAAGGAAAGIVVSVICWLPDAGVSGRPLSAIKAGLLGFLAAHHGGTTVNGVSGQFLPLGLLAGAAYFAWRAGHSIAEMAGTADHRGAAGADSPDRRAVASAWVLASVVYAGCCALLVPISRLGTSHVPLPNTIAAAFVLFAVVSGAVLVQSAGLAEPLLERLSPHRRLVVTVVGRAAALAFGVYLAAGALLAAASLIMHAGRVMELSGQVGGGFSGVPILVISALCAPNAAVAGSAYLAGPGFAVGSGTAFNAFSTSTGILPALPILGAVPDGNGASPVVLALMCTVALVAAVGVTRVVRRAGPPGLWPNVYCAAAAGAVTGLLMLIAAWLGGGSAGSGRLRVVGASPWQVAAAVAVVLSLLAVLAVLLLALWERFAATWSTAPAPEPQDSAEPELAGSTPR